MIEPGEIRSCGHSRQFVAIQVNETDVLRPELRIEAAFDKDEVGVSLMAWPLAHNDAAGTQSEERLGGSAHENRVRIYIDARNVLDKVWLQQNGLAAKIQTKQPNRPRQAVGQVR